MSSTLFQDWYIVKRNPNSGGKKIVEAYGGSPIWKPNFLYVKVPEKYFVAWNHQETNGFEAIKDDWTDEDKEKIKEFSEVFKKLEKYSKIVKWEAVQHFVPVVPVVEKEVNSTLETPVEEKKDEEVSTTVTAGPKKKKKRVAKGSEKVQRKKAKADALITKSAVEGEKIVPPATEKSNVPPVDSGPSNKQPAMDKGKGLLDGEAIIHLPISLAKMGTPEDITTFPGDLAGVLSKEPSEEEPRIDVPDEYIGIELEDDDDAASKEDVADTGNLGAQKNAGEASQSHPKNASSGHDVV
ncbi:OLC1v1030525C1 [Oldenlandia corymbosa var. corymbosa]|uniref:OLC1v1030525C1 n=1 Tax=Oldenlandia corymbosa var. corymbosa TaxID=529605 RepID=A0AAV1CJ88_OLDCO|nr:OLC1v1030525C1 [Oldenlandia corymbosa var. corymbosa]